MTESFKVVKYRDIKKGSFSKEINKFIYIQETDLSLQICRD